MEGDPAATVYHVGGMDIVLEGTNTVSGVEEAKQNLPYLRR